MKKGLLIKNCISLILFPLFIILSLNSCKKDVERDIFDSSLSFSLNGKQYKLPYVFGTFSEWGIKDGGIFINLPDIFNGSINYRYGTCAYMFPLNINISIPDNCPLLSPDFPFDSSGVYVYESGSLNVVYADCEKKSQYNYVSGGILHYEICDATATFDLTLKNKAGEIIRITEGKLQLYNFQK